jgi:multidrug efflux pump
LLTLIMVPCMYYVNERIRDKWFRKGKTEVVNPNWRNETI